MQVQRGSDHDGLYLSYLRGFVLARAKAPVDAALISGSTEHLAAWALGQDHGSGMTPVHSLRSVVEHLQAMLEDPQRTADRHDEA